MAALTIDQVGSAVHPGGVRRPEVPNRGFWFWSVGPDIGSSPADVYVIPGEPATPSIMLLVGEGLIRLKGVWSMLTAGDE